MDSHKEIVFKSDHNYPIFDILGEFTSTSDYVLSRIEIFSKEFGKPCMTNGLTGEIVYYSDIQKLVQKYAWILQNLEFKPGETILYSSGDPIRIHLFFLSVWQLGGIIRGSYPEDKETFIERLIESDCRWFVCHTRYVNEVKKILNTSEVKLKNIKILVLGLNVSNFTNDSIYLDMLQEEDFLKLKIEDFPFNRKAGKPEDIALILPTSGTSGKSKGTIYSHKTLLKNIRVHEQIAFTSQPLSDPILLTGKQSHFTGSVVPLACTASGKNLILLDEISKVNLIKTIQRFQITSVFSFPKYLIDLANDPECKNLKSIRHVITAGMIISPSIIERIRKLPNVQEIIINYGMTESGLLATNSDWTLSQKNIFKAFPEIRPYSCGKLLPGTNCKVIDIETGNSLGPGQTGELYFRTPLTSEGYFNNAEETKGTFLNDCWLKTGDLGYCDSDGFVYLVDRIKEIFKYFNNHISPSEIENIILQHKSVEEVCVVGMSDPCGGDTIPRAFVVLKQRNINNNYDITPKDIEEFTNSRLANYKHLRGGVVFVDEIPREKSGKISRNLVKKIFVNNNI